MKTAAPRRARFAAQYSVLCALAAVSVVSVAEAKKTRTRPSPAASAPSATSRPAPSGAGATRRPAPSGAGATSRPAPSGAGATTGAAATVAPTGIASVQPNTEPERSAAKLSREALGSDYLAASYASSEKKLRAAIQICLERGCSPAFTARLHRDLGALYVAAMNRTEDGKDEFALALSMDASVIPGPPLDMPAVRTAFAEVQGAAAPQSAVAQGAEGPRPGQNKRVTGGPVAGRRQAKRREPAAVEPKDSSSPVVASEFQETASPSSSAWRSVANWLSVGVQQDLMYHSQARGVCSAGSRYQCFTGGGTNWDLSNAPVAKGNEVSSSGLQLASTRILLGFERVVAKNLSLGLRLGSVVSGKAPKLNGDAPFLFFHGEARATLWLGSNPFASTGLRPYLFLSGGVAESDSRVQVRYYLRDAAGQPSAEYQADAWKRAGQGFFGTGLGFQAAFQRNHGPFIEARYIQMFSNVAPVLGVQAGYGVGF